MSGTDSLDRYFSAAVTKHSSSRKKNRGKHHSYPRVNSRDTSPSSCSSVEPVSSSQLSNQMKSFQTELNETGRRIEKLKNEVHANSSTTKPSRSRKTKKTDMDDSFDSMLRDVPEGYFNWPTHH